MFFNLRCEFLSFHIQLIQIDKQIFVFFLFCFVCLFFSYKLLPCIRLALHFVEMDVKEVSPSQFRS